MSSISRKRKVESDAPLNAAKVGTSFENNPQIAPHTSAIPSDPGESAVNKPTKAIWKSSGKADKRGSGPM